MTAEQILIALRNTVDRLRNIAPRIKAALDKQRTAPRGGLNIYCVLGCNPEEVSGEDANDYTSYR